MCRSGKKNRERVLEKMEQASLLLVQSIYAQTLNVQVNVLPVMRMKHQVGRRGKFGMKQLKNLRITHFLFGQRSVSHATQTL